MDRSRGIIGGAGAVAIAAVLVVAAAAMVAEPARDGARLMSSLRVAGLAGFRVVDSRGRTVGKVLRVETDGRGRTRYVRARLNDGEKVRVAAFRARLDRRARTVDLTVPVASVMTDPGALIAPAPDANRFMASSDK